MVSFHLSATAIMLDGTYLFMLWIAYWHSIVIKTEAVFRALWFKQNGSL